MFSFPFLIPDPDTMLQKKQASGLWAWAVYTAPLILTQGFPILLHGYLLATSTSKQRIITLSK